MERVNFDQKRCKGGLYYFILIPTYQPEQGVKSHLGLPFSVQIGVKVNGRKIVGDKKLKLKFMILVFAESLI